ncbi:MAG TPA: antibiotic biosynthesis monooxygenase [Thermoanaerobaculia bacterium]|nr:antibiotic biosynthesis monooxygenase [Thermoanaerobaculia bacterium]
MYVRFVRLRVREGEEERFRRYYDERVLPALQATEGCLYAALLRPWRGEDHQSLTIWESAEKARAYEDGGLYHSLLRGAEPMLAASTEWRVRLSDDVEETGDLQRREIPPEGYTLEVGDAPQAVLHEGEPTFVRVVSIHVDPARLDDFVRIYRESVIPVLQGWKGCRGALLVEGARNPGEILSISLWDREEDAVRYELSGEFDRLTYRLKDTFSRVHDWRVSLGTGQRAGVDTPEVESYHLVTARRLGGSQGGDG